MKFIHTFAFICLVSCIGCTPSVSRNEVAVAASPDGRLEADLYETNGGATTSFGYEVEIRKRGQQNGILVALLYGAVRNTQAYGANLKWNGDNELDIEYLHTKTPPTVHRVASIDSKNIYVSVKEGITDPAAPSGGMLYNLNRK